MKLINSIYLAALFIVSNSAIADVVLSRVDGSNPKWKTNPHLFISGNIERGDYEKTLNAVKETYATGDIRYLFVRLNSPGGDVVEAMKIGELVRNLKLYSTTVGTQCYSACFLIFVAGGERNAPGNTIGIHRPYFEKKYFSSLSADEANNKYETLMALTEKYLVKMGVPKELIEKMFNIPSNEIEMLSLDEVQKWIGGSPASLDEWLIAKCGSYTTEEGDDLAMWQVDRIKLKTGYANYLKEKVNKVDSCRRKNLWAERDRVASEMFPKVKVNEYVPDWAR